MAFVKNFLSSRYRAFASSGSWALIVLGLALFSARIPLAPDGIINAPVTASIVQTLGLLFTAAGLLMMLSILLWPSIKVDELVRNAVDYGHTASAFMLCGLLVFNGIAFYTIVFWMATSLGIGLVG